MLRIALATAGIAAIALGIWFLPDRTSDVRPVAVATATAPPAAPAPVPVEPAERIATAPHPVSLAAYAAKEFDGRDLKLGAVLADNAAYTRRYITYKSGALTISGIMNVPKGKGPFPLLVLNHGHIDTSIYTNGRGLKREQDYLARNGYAVLHTDYRGHAQSDPDPDADHRLRLGYVEDAINAVLAVRQAALPQIDAERVGMLGHSMGGGVTLNALVAAPQLVDAAVLFAPVSGDARENYARWTQRRAETAARIAAEYGSPEKNPEFWDGVSAIRHLDQVAAPVLLHHGTADESTPYAWSVALSDAFKTADRELDFHTYEGEPHEFIHAWPLVMRRTVEFFDKNLKNAGDR